MVALPLAPSCIRIRVLGKANTSSIAHIMHGVYSGGTPSNADATAIANAFRASWNTRFASLLPATTQYTTFEVVDLGTLSGSIGVNTTTVTGTQVASPTTPNSACQVISWKVNLRYRGGHARTYLPYSSATALTNGNQLPSTQVANLTTAATGFLTDFNAITSGTITLQLCAVSYFHQHVMRPNGIPLVITGATVHNRVDTQRRRLGKEF